MISVDIAKEFIAKTASVEKSFLYSFRLFRTISFRNSQRNLHPISPEARLKIWPNLKFLTKPRPLDALNMDSSTLQVTIVEIYKKKQLILGLFPYHFELINAHSGQTKPRSKNWSVWVVWVDSFGNEMSKSPVLLVLAMPKIGLSLIFLY